MGHGGRVNDGNGGERVGRGAEESGADPGEGRGRRGGREGERGEWEGGPRKRGRWRPYPLAGFTAGEVVRRQRAPVPTGSGEQGRGEGGGGLGRGRGGATQFGPGGFGADGPRVQWGGRPAPFFFSDCFCFLFSFYLFISFSVLFHLKYLGIL